MTEYRIVSEATGYALFQGPRRVADLYGFYADCKPIAQQLNRAAAIDELLETCKVARDALLGRGRYIDPRIKEGIKHLEDIGAQLDAAIVAAEGDNNV